MADLALNFDFMTHKGSKMTSNCLQRTYQSTAMVIVLRKCPKMRRYGRLVYTDQYIYCTVYTDFQYTDSVYTAKN